MRYFKEVKARKEQLLSCGHVVSVSEIYWRNSSTTMCDTCQERQRRQIYNWWDGLWEYREGNSSDYIEQYGNSSDWEQTMMADFERQCPKPKAIFLRKEAGK